jgi:hypothetical protein
MFQVMDQAFVGANDSDMVGVQIRHPSLVCAAYNVPFVRRAELTPERVFAILEKMVQSGCEIDVSEDLVIIFTTVRDVRGGRPASRVWNHRDWMEKHSHSFIRVNNRDNLCLARALVVAKVREDKKTDPTATRLWNAIRQENILGNENNNKRNLENWNTVQRRKAVELMENCGLANHQGECGLKEMQKFQDYLAPEYQIKVFSALAMNFLVFQGPTAAKILHLYHDCDSDGSNGHFIVCTKPHVIFNTQHFCDECNRGYNDKKLHRYAFST